MNKHEFIYTAFTLTMVQLFLVQAYREHKVHNIVLYPDKHSWCKTTTIKQVISYPGCTSIEIDNNVCVGACFSYSIPHTEPSDPGEVIVPYCDSCQPSETIWHQITLQCSKNDADNPSQLIKNVQIIQNCSCTPCGRDSLNLTKFPESSDDLSLKQNVDAELLDAIQTRNNSKYNNNLNSDRIKTMNILLYEKLFSLLKNIEINNTNYDKDQLLDLFNIIQEPTNSKFKAKSIIDFIESLNQTNKTDLDIPRLTDLLLKFEHSKHSTKLNKHSFGSDNPTSDDVSDDENQDVYRNEHQDHLNKWKADISVKENINVNLPAAVWARDPHELSSEHLESHHTVLPSDTSNESRTKTDLDHAQDIRPPQDASDKSVKMDVSGERAVDDEHRLSSHPHSHSHLHQHHVNDNVLSHGHLTRGPHGALVIKPDPIHEKLDVNAHELKPNHAGTLLSYHSHSGEGNTHK